jgi:hypothetical protein
MRVQAITDEIPIKAVLSRFQSIRRELIKCRRELRERDFESSETVSIYRNPDIDGMR